MKKLLLAALALSIGASSAVGQYRSMTVERNGLTLMTLNLDSELRLEFTPDSLVASSTRYKVMWAISDVTGWHYGTEYDPTAPGAETTDSAYMVLGDGSAANPFNVWSLLRSNPSGHRQWVTGCIVGSYTGSNMMENANFTTKGHVAANIILAPKAGITKPEQCIAVQLPFTSSVRPDLNLVDHPENIGREVTVCGTIGKVGGGKGVKETSAYNWGNKGISTDAIEGVAVDAPALSMEGGTLTISGITNAAEVMVTDMAGRYAGLVQLDESTQTAVVDLSGFNAGIYIVTFKGQSVKIVKQ